MIDDLYLYLYLYCPGVGVGVGEVDGLQRRLSSSKMRLLQHCNRHLEEMQKASKHSNKTKTRHESDGITNYVDKRQVRLTIIVEDIQINSGEQQSHSNSKKLLFKSQGIHTSDKSNSSTMQDVDERDEHKDLQK